MTIFEKLMHKYESVPVTIRDAYYSLALKEIEDHLFEGDITRSEQVKLYSIVGEWLND